MSIKTLLEETALVNLGNNSAAAQTLVQSARVDMAGFDGCLFLVKIGTIDATGTVTVTAHQAPTDAAGDELSGSSVALTDADDDSVVAIDVRDPEDRFLSVEIARATADSEVDSILAIQYRGSGLLPLAQAADIHTPAAGVLVKPAEV